MNSQNPFSSGDSCCGTNYDMTVDQLLGNAYQVVKFVAMRMPFIKTLSDNIDDLIALAGSLEGLNDLAAKLPELMSLQAELQKLIVLYDNLSKLVLVADNMTQILTVHDNLPQIQTIVDNLTQIQTVVTNIANIVAVGNNINAVNNVHNNMSAVLNVNTNMAVVTNVSTNMTDVRTVATNMPQVQAVAANMVEIQAVYAKLADLELIADQLDDMLTKFTDLASSTGSTMVGFLQSGVNAVARTVQDKMRDTVSVKDFGAKGDYVTDDTAAINKAAAAVASMGGGVLWFPAGVYGCTDGVTIPAGVYISGAGSPIMGTFPTHQDDKRFLRPGYKHLIPGACLIFKGEGSARGTTVREAPYDSFTFAVRMIGSNAPARWEGVGVVMDMDVLDAAGNVTFAADDHRSNYDVGFFLDDSCKGQFEANVFGYWKVAGVLNYGNDPDQNVFRDGASSGERGFVNLATGDAGLSGTNLNNWNLFANDHHKRDPVTAQWGTSAFEVNSTNGYLVSGFYIRGGRINTYCETPVILNDAREVWFDQTVMELPYYDSPGARDTKFIGNAACDRIGFVGCRWSGTNPIYGEDRLAGQISGSIFLYGGPPGINPNAALEVLHGGQAARIRVSDSGPDIQLSSSYATSTSGVRLRRNPADGTLGIMFDGSTRAIVNDAGVVSSSGGQAGKTGASSAASPALMPYSGDLASGIYRANNLIGLSINGTAAAVWTPTEHRPGADNVQSLGRSDLRFTTAYLTSNPVVTSDAREKEQVGELPDAWLDAWGDTRLVRFKWIDRVALKGDGARYHIGVISQEFRDALIARGVDPEEVAAWCRDEWADEYEDVLETVLVEQADGTFADEERPTGERRLVRAAGDRLGLRETQCLFLSAAYERRERKRLEQLVSDLAKRVASLEARVQALEARL